MGKRVGDGLGETAPEFQFEFHSPGVDVPPDVHNYTREKLAAKLHKFSGKVICVKVFINDVNGSKGGVDKHCRMEALLAGLEPVNVLEQHGDLRALIDLTIDRFEFAVQRHVERSVAKGRHKGRKVARNKKLATM